MGLTAEHYDRKAEIVIERLERLASQIDKEAAHSDADKLLCELLTDLGYGDVVAAWENVEKWYA